MYFLVFLDIFKPLWAYLGKHFSHILCLQSVVFAFQVFEFCIELITLKLKMLIFLLDNPTVVFEMLHQVADLLCCGHELWTIFKLSIIVFVIIQGFVTLSIQSKRIGLLG